jgi:predicted DCC family thiol-disulfide oxidoreductase YuxK
VAWQVEVFFDGECPLCRREIEMLRRRDRSEQIRFTDIAAPAFNAAELGLDRQALTQRIHARLPDGHIIEGVEVFRRLYAAVGFGGVVRLSRLPGVSQLFDAAYALFAKNRLRLTGRCADGACAIHPSVPAQAEKI